MDSFHRGDILQHLSQWEHLRAGRDGAYLRKCWRQCCGWHDLFLLHICGQFSRSHGIGQHFVSNCGKQLWGDCPRCVHTCPCHAWLRRQQPGDHIDMDSFHRGDILQHLSQWEHLRAGRDGAYLRKCWRQCCGWHDLFLLHICGQFSRSHGIGQHFVSNCAKQLWGDCPRCVHTCPCHAWLRRQQPGDHIDMDSFHRGDILQHLSQWEHLRAGRDGAYLRKCWRQCCGWHDLFLLHICGQFSRSHGIGQHFVSNCAKQLWGDCPRCVHTCQCHAWLRRQQPGDHLDMDSFHRGDILQHLSQWEHLRAGRDGAYLRKCWRQCCGWHDLFLLHICGQFGRSHGIGQHLVGDRAKQLRNDTASPNYHDAASKSNSQRGHYCYV